MLHGLYQIQPEAASNIIEHHSIPQHFAHRAHFSSAALEVL